MIRINLLPYREEKKRLQRQRFYITLTASLLSATLLVFAGYKIIDSLIEHQERRNTFLQQEIGRLDKQIEQISQLKAQTQLLLSRKKTIELLQSNRADAVHIMSEMVQQVPDGVYLRSIVQEGNKLTLSGYTRSNTRISNLMRNLESSPWLVNPKLLEIKATTLDKQRASEFSLTVMLAPPKSNPRTH